MMVLANKSLLSRSLIVSTSGCDLAYLEERSIFIATCETAKIFSLDRQTNQESFPREEKSVKKKEQKADQYYGISKH
jgi:hypothetical protein